ncbi:MAG: O-antigen ligase family protein [Crocinitomicaceae bacterium]|nr:O-antigen ligase family protein [Crocinitomicaceae bacterium]
MMKSWTYKSAFDSYLGMFAVVMIVFPKLVALAVLPIVGFIVYGVRKKVVEFKFSWIAAFFMLFYIAYAIGVLYTNHEDIAFKYLEYKLSFFITPILLSFRYKEGTFSLSKIAAGLIIAVVISGVYGIINASLCYMDEGTWGCFLTGTISPLHHPSYFMSFIVVAMVIAWIGVRRKWKGYRLLWVIPFTLFGFGFHIMSLSLAGVLFLLLTLGITVLYIIYRKWGWIATSISVIIVPIVGYMFIMGVPQIEGEWNGAKWYAEEYFKDSEKFVRETEFPMAGSAERLIMWTVSIDEFQEHPLGVGTGNLDEVLGARLRDLNQPELADKALNPHNQFIQTAVEIGVFGLIILVIIMLYAVYVAYKERNGLLLLIVGNLMFNSLFESMLQRQSGVVFFTFWICLLVIHRGMLARKERVIE